MNKKMKKVLVMISIILFAGSAALHAQNRQQNRNQNRYRMGQGTGGGLDIVCSFSDFAKITERIAGDKGSVSYIAHGEQDPHFVPPKPSYAMMLHNADMWITTGMDLEIWSSTLLDKARNRKIMDGEIGFVSASDGVSILEKVEKVDRTEGDIHLMGNPHINTGPLNWIPIATNITTGLVKSDPANEAYYRRNLSDYSQQVYNALFGEELVSILGGETLAKMLGNNTLFPFLDNEYKGEVLSDKLGGWLEEAEAFRGMKIVAYHKNWSYLLETFGLEVVGYIEPKPGIPPSARHVEHIIQTIEKQGIQIMLMASYFEKKTAQMIESKTGIKAVFLPLYVNGVPEATDNFKLMDYWISQIKMNL